MAEHTACYEVNSSQDASSGSHRPDAVYLNTALLGWATDNVKSLPIPKPTIPFPATDRPRSGLQRVTGFVKTTDGSGASISQHEQKASWMVDGLFTNNTGASIGEESVATGSGRASPDLELLFIGDVKTAIDLLTGDPNQIDIVTERIISEYTGGPQFIEFENKPPNTTESSADALRRLLYKLGSGGGGNFSLGGDLVANNCRFAAVNPWGSVYIRPEDINAGAQDIPDSVTNNTAEHFRAHPSVFFRRTDYIRQITRGYQDSTSVNTGGGQGMPLEVIVVADDPETTLWLFVIDGVHTVVRVIHPSGSDLRRPRDIWNALIEPLVNGAPALGLSPIFANVQDDATESILIGRLAYLQYACCLPIPGTRHIQTGSDEG